MTTLNIPLSKTDKERLTIRAKRFGFPLYEFSLLALKTFIPLPQESLREYEHPLSIKKAIRRARKEYREGKVHTTL